MIKVEGNKITTKGSNADIIAEVIGAYTQVFGGLFADNVVMATSMLFTTIEELTDIMRSIKADYLPGLAKEDVPTS